jgi:hypothetical protein
LVFWLLHVRVETRHVHAERLLAKAGGSKCKERGITHRSEAEAAGGRSAQAQRGRPGILLACARGGAPLRARREGRFGEEKAPLRWVAEDVHFRPETGRILPPYCSSL